MNQKYQRNNTDYRFTPVDGEMVMLHKPTGNLIGMNTVAAAIWMHIEQPKLFSEIIDFLLQNFEIDKATCETETQAILNRMINDNMVMKSEPVEHE